MIECWSFLHFSHFSKDREKSDKKMLPGPPKAPKLRPRWASWRHHGPSWAQLAANLAHLASILGPSSLQLRKISTKSSRSAPRHPKKTQGVARGLQDSPWSLNFHGFGVDFGLHLQIYFKGFDALCDPMLNPSSKPQVWHGGGFARAAHWIL